ncbi:MAG: DISARM system phospholipase D-like protein DrmC [Nannocystaceae bacterium]
MNDAFLALPLVELERLLAAVAVDKLSAPLSDGALIARDLAAARPFLPLLARFSTAASLRTFLECVVAQRRAAEQRPRPELVWSGPEPEHARARHTSVVVRELFERARQEVFIAGYSFHGGDKVLGPLHASMVAHGTKVEIVLDCSGYDVYEGLSEAEILGRVASEFREEVWTHGDPRPSLLYDPRTLKREPPRSGTGRWFPPHSMHAKCIVVDRREAFVGSANFTARAHAKNIEVGVLIREPGFAAALLHQWDAVRSVLSTIGR